MRGSLLVTRTLFEHLFGRSNAYWLGRDNSDGVMDPIAQEARSKSLSQWMLPPLAISCAVAFFLQPALYPRGRRISLIIWAISWK